MTTSTPSPCVSGARTSRAVLRADVASRSKTRSAPIRIARSRRAAGAPIANDGRRAAERRQGDRAQADGAGPLNEHGVAGPQRGALEDVDGGQQPAAAADVVVEAHTVRQPRDADARLEIDGFRPAAEESFVGRIGDAVDAAGVTARRRAMHRAGATPAAGAVHVEEHDAVALPQGRTVEARAADHEWTRASRPRRGRG